MKEEAAKVADPETLTNRNIVDHPNSEQRKNEGITDPEKVVVDFLGDGE